MNYKNFNLGDWIGHISGVIEDESELDGNEMRDLVEFLSMLKQKPCDAISRQAVIDTIESWLSCDNYNEAERHIMRAMQSVLYDLPPVTPYYIDAEIQKMQELEQAEIQKAYELGKAEQPEIEHCKDCKHWKDSDGTYRRDINAESKCPMNRKEVYEGTGYCFLFESKTESKTEE